MGLWDDDDIDEFNELSEEEKEELLSEYDLDVSEQDYIVSSDKNDSYYNDVAKSMRSEGLETVSKPSDIALQFVREENATNTYNTSSDGIVTNTVSKNDSLSSNRASAGDSFAVGFGALILIVFIILLIAGIISFISKIPLVAIEYLIYFGIAVWCYISFVNSL